MTLENLAQIGKLKPHKTTRAEIARLLAAVRRNLKDARHADISPESRFDIAYKAVMANGFRPSTSEPGHHATVIQSLPKTVGLSNERVIVLDKLRKKRNLSDYSGEGIGDEEAAACVRAAGPVFQRDNRRPDRFGGRAIIEALLRSSCHKRFRP